MQSSAYLKHHIPAFKKLLSRVNVEKISSGTYCRRYLAHLLDHQHYYLTIYVKVLGKIVEHAATKKENIVLIDYGAGNGMLGIFAKYCGFKKVFLNDIDDKFIGAAKELAEQLNIPVDGYIAGDVNALLPSCMDEKPTAIAGTDVIEHIYNLDDFFSILKQINPNIISVFTTASNPNNFFKVRQLKKLQLRDEYEGGTPDDFALFGEESHESFLKIREQVIRKNFNELNDIEIKKLSEATRGLNEKDIVDAVHTYKMSKRLPQPPAHPTNTCNPISGSWTERVLTINEYQAIYNAAGFRLIVNNGFYDIYKKTFKSMVNRLLNTAIVFFGKKISPFIVLTGFKK